MVKSYLSDMAQVEGIEPSTFDLSYTRISYKWRALCGMDRTEGHRHTTLSTLRRVKALDAAQIFSVHP